MINAKYLGLTANQLAETASKLEAENACLRELCADMLRGIAHVCMEQTTPHEVLREFSDRMLKMGVEYSDNG